MDLQFSFTFSEHCLICSRNMPWYDDERFRYNEYDDEDATDSDEESSASEESSEDTHAQRERNVDEWKKQAGKLKSKDQSIYMLTFEEWDHSANYGSGPDKTVIGVFESKEAAVAKSVTVETWYGTFDDAIKSTFHEEGDYEDNRENPPDDGILLQIGGEDIGAGDYARLLIKKIPIIGFAQGCSLKGDKKKAASVDKKKAAPASKRSGAKKIMVGGVRTPKKKRNGAKKEASKTGGVRTPKKHMYDGDQDLYQVLY